MNFDFSYYTITVYFSLACSFAAAVIGYKYKNKFSELKLFYLYPLASFIQTFLFVTFTYLHVEKNILDYIGEDGAIIFSLVEFFMIYYFFWQVLLSRLIKLLLLAITIPSVISLFYVWTTRDYRLFSIPVFIMQGIFILIPCFFYVFKLFRNQSGINLFTNPNFWITLGVVAYFSCTMPLFLMIDFLFNKNTNFTYLNIYSINFIFYGILYLLTIKAYLCPKRDTP